LNRARVALKQDPKRALSLTGQHKQLYPNGALSQEREVIAIDALARLNKKRDAEKRADRFDKQYPESAHKEKVRTSVDDD
jgi:outer membrane protein assembly factor BamD (BamD/ComL family)